MNKCVRYCNIFFWFLYYRNCVLQKDQEKNGYLLKMYDWILKVYVDLCTHELPWFLFYKIQGQNWLKKFQITRILIIMKNQSLKFFSKLWVNLKILLTLVLYVHQHDILSMHYGLPHLNTIAIPWLSG